MDSMINRMIVNEEIMDGEGKYMSNEPKPQGSIMGQRMFELRKSRGWTQGFVAKKLGKKPSTYSGWENSPRLPPTEIVPELARVFECTIDYLYGRTNDPQKTLAEEITRFDDADILVLQKLKLSNEEIKNLTDDQVNEIRAFIEFQISRHRGKQEKGSD